MLRAFLGSYSDGGGEGIYRVEIDSEAGTISEPVLAARQDNASWLTFADGFLLATVERPQFRGRPEGGLAVYRAAANGELALLRSYGSGSGGPCHICWGPQRRLVCVSNYVGGTFSLSRLEGQGGLAAAAHIDHNRGGPRQAHVHCCALSRDERTLFVCDLGLDRVMEYDLTRISQPRLRREIAFPDGSGPRHAVLSADERVLYVLCELSNELHAIDAACGEVLAHRSILSAGEEGYASAIRLAGDGAVAASCRGTDLIGFYELGKGELRLRETLRLRGSYPRDIALVGDGLLLAAYEKSDLLQLLGRGAAGEWRERAARRVPAPTCICV